VGTIVHYLLYKKVPALDRINRPKVFFGELIHDHCGRRGQFEAGNFLADWNDPAQKKYCLYLKGCKGPVTYADCATRNWSDGHNWCIGSGAPCQGCSEPTFYTGMSPLYAKTVELAGTSVESVGSVMTIATAAALGAHFVGQSITKRLGDGGPEDQSSDRKGGDQ
jgi:hydrogenase small subunit